MNSMILILAEVQQTAETATPKDSEISLWAYAAWLPIVLFVVWIYFVNKKNQKRASQQKDINDRALENQSRSLALLERIATAVEKLENKP